MTDNHALHRFKLIGAFIIVYVVWGSTYLATKIALDTIPTWLMGGSRFVTAGALLYLWARLTGAKAPTLRQWKDALIIGIAYSMIGYSCVMISVQMIPSGIVSLIIASLPLFLVLMDKFSPKPEPPGKLGIAGIVVGIIGLMILFNPMELIGGRNFSLLGIGVVIFGTISWAAGTIYLKGITLPESKSISSAMQMLTGGLLLTIIGLVRGEATDINFAAFSVESILSLAYLIIFGSIIAFTAFVWLARNTTAAKLSTYAYVNPIVAMFLGVTIGHESIIWRDIIAAVIILAGVVLIISGKKTAQQKSRIPLRSRYAVNDR